MIYIGLGYLDSHVVSTKFAIGIALLSLYFILSNHTATGSIVKTALKYIFYLCSFLLIMYAPIGSTQILLHDISLANLFGNLPHFLFDFFLCWQVSQLVTYFRTVYLIPGQYKCWQVVAFILSIPG